MLTKRKLRNHPNSSAKFEEAGDEPFQSSVITLQQTGRFVLLFTYLAWISLIACGIASYEGEPITVTSKDLPLHYFDVIFRRFGALLLFTVWAARASILFALQKPWQLNKGLVLRACALYIIQAVVRSIVYLLHATGYIFTPQRWARDNMKHPPHIMSDHILLGSAVMGGCGCEATLSLIHLWSAQPKSLEAICFKLHAVAATMLAVLVSCECYFTSRYFHPPGEILLGALLGFLLFQLPLVILSISEMDRLCQCVSGDSVEGGFAHNPSRAKEVDAAGVTKQLAHQT